jgi:hypothetical protein
MLPSRGPAIRLPASGKGGFKRLEANGVLRIDPPPKRRSEEDPMAGDMDTRAHAHTYGKVIGMLKWGGVACAAIAAGC